MKNHLFHFTIGPVQSFIAQARKTQDLFAGSQLLSVLCKTAADDFDNRGGEIIFPKLGNESVPNRFLGKWTKEGDLPKIGKDVKNSVIFKWRQIAKEAFEKIGIEYESWPSLKEQIENHLDIQWLFVPIGNSDYAEAYNEAVKWMNAVKTVRTRPFGQFNDGMGETGRKCGLDGERNVKFYRLSARQPSQEKVKESLLFDKDNEVYEYKNYEQMPRRLLQPGEGLSGVSLLKRSYSPDGKKSEFPSTAEIALKNSLQPLIDAKKYLVFDEFRLLVGAKNWDSFNWQLFYDENLNKDYFLKKGLPEGAQEEAKKKQKRIAQIVKDNNRSIDKYYALLLFDGDNMGAWWNGKNLKPGVDLERFHKDTDNDLNDLPACLAAFAQKINDIFKDDKKGKVVYAGGDDFLGFVNLHHLFSIIRELKDQYHKLVDSPLQKFASQGKHFTFSAGICIAHYKEPLSLVLGKARKLEQNAKNFVEEKNCFAIGVIPGSGEVKQFVLSLDYIHLLNDITDALRNDFSTTFIDTIRREFKVLMDRNGKSVVATGIEESIIHRLVKRAYKIKLKNDEDIEKFEENKGKAIESLQSTLITLKKKSGNLEQFISALEIADFIERHTEVTKPQENR